MCGRHTRETLQLLFRDQVVSSGCFRVIHCPPHPSPFKSLQHNPVPVPRVPAQPFSSFIHPAYSPCTTLSHPLPSHPPPFLPHPSFLRPISCPWPAAFRANLSPSPPPALSSTPAQAIVFSRPLCLLTREVLQQLMCPSFAKRPELHPVSSLSTSTFVWRKDTPRWPLGALGWSNTPVISNIFDCNVRFRAVLI